MAGGNISRDRQQNLPASRGHHYGVDGSSNNADYQLTPTSSTPENSPATSSYSRLNHAAAATTTSGGGGGGGSASLVTTKEEAKTTVGDNGFSSSVSPVPSMNLHSNQAITAAASASSSMKGIEEVAYEDEKREQQQQQQQKKPQEIGGLHHIAINPSELNPSATLNTPSMLRGWTYGSKYVSEITIRRSIFFGLWGGIHLMILLVRLFRYPEYLWGFCMATQAGIMTCLIAIYICMSPTFLYLINRSILPRVITFEKNVHAHKVAAYTLLFWTICHVAAYYYNYISYVVDQNKHPEKHEGEEKYTIAGLLLGRYYGWTGHVILLFYISMFVTSIIIVRRRYFELFYYVHQLHIPITVLLFIHGKSREFPKFLVAPLAIYVVDRLYRLVRGYVGHTNITTVIQHPSNVYEIRIKKRWFRPTRPGQYIRINCPTIAPLQWHPFTLTSAPEEEMITHIKVVGTWSNELAKALGCDFNITKSLSKLSLNDMYDTDAIYNPQYTSTDYVEEESGGRYKTSVKITVPRLSGFEESAKKKGVFSRCKGFVKSIREVEEGGIKRSNTVLSTAKTDFKPTTFDDDSDTFTDVVIPKIFVDGSYEAPAENIFNYKVTIMIGAGIGVTPFASVLRSIRYKLRQTPDKLKMQKVYFIWVCRDEVL
ncbi:hypothetical protein H4219_005069 [Mycoemilia scoparia]|uniref:FAD-binding FR-type domain-containing protein n=1 Tax=Mycoemilia scoparia TaxID=417184 RepID=A0A9W7ZPC5_9FUNG|nr:hypothetical protein H4219_005069 [Mycoemilia scoparia]